MQHTNTNVPNDANLYEAAMAYIDRGFSVIPIRVSTKSPSIQWRTYQERMPTEQEIESWFKNANTKETGVAIVTGEISGIAVVDMDTEDAVQYARERNFAGTPMVKTAKGYHAYYLHKPGLRNFQTRKALPGIDLRAEGGYIIAPPSMHPSGKQYQWVNKRGLSDLPIAEGPWDDLYPNDDRGQPEQRPLAAIYHGVGEGERNISLARLAGSWIKDGLTFEECLDMAEAWNARNSPPMKQKEVESTIKSIFATNARSKNVKVTQKEEWPDPIPLPEKLSPVMSLDHQIIPVPLRGWLLDIADRMQIPPDFSTAAAIVALGSIIGRGCGIYPKRRDNWQIIPNLWGGVIGRPSLMKSPAISQAHKPLVMLEKECRAIHKQAMKSFKVDQIVMKAAKSAIDDEIKKAVKADNLQAIEETRLKLEKLIIDVPIRRRFHTQDSTIEKLGEILNENPRGILINRDELIGWLRSLSRDGREQDRAFYLEGWNGNQEFTYDRIGRGTLDVEAHCVSVFGALTPGNLTEYVYQANRGGKGDDGLLQRFQVMVWPDPPKDWKNVDRFPNTDERNRVFQIFKKLAGDIPGAGQKVEGDIPALRFSPAGQEIFDSWYSALEIRLRTDETIPPSMDSHLGKYKKLMPALALIFHLIDLADGKESGPVSEQAALMAVSWCSYLESHAVRIYGGALWPEMESAREIVKHIRSGEIKDGCSPRDIYRRQWSKLSQEETRAGLSILEDFEWLSIIRERNQNGGRPSEIIRLNPKLKL